jgi:membrane protease YdiL (CAAX protease family)
MPMSRGANLRVTALGALCYAAAICVAEAFIAYWDVSIGVLLHAVLVFLLVNRFVFAGAIASASGERHQHARGANAALALALVPLLRLLGLTMTVDDLPPTARYAVVGAPLLAATILAVHLGPFRNVAPRLRAWSWRVEAPIGLSGIPLGLAAWVVAGRPGGLVDSSDWGRLALGAAILLVFTGLAEEFLFRGVVQEGLTRVLGGGGVAVTALLFGCTYLSVGPAVYVVFLTTVGFAFGWHVRRTESLLGVGVAHGLMNVGLLLFWPTLA